MDGLGGTSEVAERDLERIGRGIAEDDLVGVEVPVLAAKLGISNQSSPAIRSCVRKKGQSSLSITRLSCASAMDMGTGDDLTMEGTTSAMGRAFRFLDLELGVPGTEEAGAVKSLQGSFPMGQKSESSTFTKSRKLTSKRFQRSLAAVPRDIVAEFHHGPASPSALGS